MQGFRVWGALASNYLLPPTGAESLVFLPKA